MIRSKLLALFVPVALSIAGPASALNIAIETFEDGSSGWTNGPRTGVTWNATGGHDGGAYISTTGDINTTTSSFGSALIQFRCEVTVTPTVNNCSDGDFQGDWIGNEVLTLSFWMRHDSDISLQPYIRIPAPAPNGNNPAASAIYDVMVAPNTWTEVVLNIDPNNPEFDAAFGGAGYNGIFSSVSRLQPGIFFEFGQVYNETGVTFDIDDVRLTAVPIPAAVWLLGSGLVGLFSFARVRRS